MTSRTSTAAAARPAPEVLHLSLIVGARLEDHMGAKLGRVDDLIVHLGGSGFPPITGLLATLAGRASFVPANRVELVEHGRVVLRSARLDLRPFERRADEVLLRKDMLDRQLINVEGARLVRANEIEIAGTEGGGWRAVGVDTSPRAFLRRLLPRRFGARIASTHFLGWEHVEPFVGHVPTVRLRVPHPKLAQLHPAQIADLVEAASHSEGAEIIQAVSGDRELEADVFEELDPRHQLEFLRARPDRQIAALLSRMESDDAAHLLADLPEDRREGVFLLLPFERRRKIRVLLGYDPATAGGLMSSEQVTTRATATVADALDRVRGSSAPDELRSVVFVVASDGTLRGAISLPTLVGADPHELVETLITGRPVSVAADLDIEDVARTMADFDLICIAVVDYGGQVIGAVTVDDVLEIVLPTSWRRRFAMIGGE